MAVLAGGLNSQVGELSATEHCMGRHQSLPHHLGPRLMFTVTLWINDAIGLDSNNA